MNKDVTEESRTSVDRPVSYVFCLYVAGLSPRSQRAISAMKDICNRYLENDYELEIVDIYQQPALAKAAQIVAVPTLVRKLPQPVRKFIGDIARREHILVAIGKTPKGEA